MTSAPALLVIADDLTGAADTGVQFASRGIPTLVTLEPVTAWREAAADAQVLVASTDSRHLAPRDAAARVRDVVAWARDTGVPHIYKKIDSTLRGNVGAELEACLQASGARVLPLVPAFPAMGRATRAGHVYVHGQPLDRTPFAGDPREPSGEGDIGAVLGRQTSLPIVVAAPGDEAVPAEGILIVDADTDDDLARAGRWLARHHLLPATAGSAGFAAQLPGLLGLDPAPIEPPRYPERVLAVCGSVNGVSLEQADRAEAEGLTAVRLGPDLLLADDAALAPASEAIIAAVREHDLHGRRVLLRTAGDRGDLDACEGRGAALGLGRQDVHDRVAANVGRTAGAVLNRLNFDLLIVVGGDTLRAVAGALAWTGLRPLGELLPGVPVSATMGGHGPRMVVSKAGGYGPPDMLVRMVRTLGAGAA